MAAESIYNERCIAVDDGPSWAKYMSISGSPDDEYDIITLQYTEEGLLTVDENKEGCAAAFGDDIAIECLSTRFKREIYVDVKCQECFNITTVFSHSQIVVVCGNCQTVLCQPTGGHARLTKGCSFRRKGD